MMKRPSPEEEKRIKDIRNLYTLEKKSKTIKFRILKEIEHEEKQNYYKQERVAKF